MNHHPTETGRIAAPISFAQNATTHELSLLDGFHAVPPGVAQRYGVVPLRYEGHRLIAGALDPYDLRGLDALHRLGHNNAVLEPLSQERYQEIMAKWYGPSGDVAEYVLRLPRLSPAEPSLKAGDKIEISAAPRFLNLTLRAAIAEGASDVHIEPDPTSPRVRFRVDGDLADRVPPPPWLMGRVIGRIKAMAGLALGECFFAQDGKFEFPTRDGAISIRVSILPSDRGECVVLRLLTVENHIPSLETLGLPQDMRQQLVRAAAAHEGLIVFAGPTGSGKSTALHALLETVDSMRRNIVSIEDPVEIRSSRIRQVPVRREVGLDFAGALRVVLRQDPDVILVGETRDTETAELVVQAALAGHLVLTTIHATSALHVFERFAQLGVDRSLLAQVTRLTVSQRLLRRLCPDCAGKGCFICEGAGLKGRAGLFEILPRDAAVVAAIREGAPLDVLYQKAQAAGYRSLWQRAQDLVRAGVTTSAEVHRVLDTDAADVNVGDIRQ